MPNEVGGEQTCPPNEVHEQLKQLLSNCNNTKVKNLDDIIDFHKRFEAIQGQGQNYVLKHRVSEAGLQIPCFYVTGYLRQCAIERTQGHIYANTLMAEIKVFAFGYLQSAATNSITDKPDYKIILIINKLQNKYP